MNHFYFLIYKSFTLSSPVFIRINDKTLVFNFIPNLTRPPGSDLRQAGDLPKIGQCVNECRSNLQRFEMRGLVNLELIIY